MVRIAYITLLGRSPWAVVNTYYKLLKEGKPKGKIERVYIFTEERYKKNLQRVVRALEAISKAYNLEPRIETVIIPDHGFSEAERKFRELFSKLESEGYRIGLDITSGRKALVAAAIVQAREFPVSFIVYMALLDMDFPDRPYMMIPTHMQPLKNFLGDGDEAR
ncbi:TM1812 family CRISPR-associated protein [Thermococcus sp.]|uniref:TM1812 family CRISPR-associated protein n=1 Tax=Thermococcus sp. TaxID=35749 RepID=UPI0026396E50|nr:TM1812 family CRISPR-associated protein [Thermococcus sp.]